MRKGLVLGKFYPLHLGHVTLIRYALEWADLLYVLVCASDRESMDGSLRASWIEETFRSEEKVKVRLLAYSERELPNTSQSSREVSKKWAGKILELFDDIDVVFSSEPYGDYLAEYLNCQHVFFDQDRTAVPVSATQIRQNPLQHWDFIAEAARPFFVRKICISGTESTGKSILAQRLAAHYQTEYVPEMAREIVQETDTCTMEHLHEIAALQARTIDKKLKTANRLLFVDTDVNITRSYARFLFQKELKTEDWIDRANQFDLHLYLDNDSPYVQDGTRLDERRRNELNEYHLDELRRRGVDFQVISGDWEERFWGAVLVVGEWFAVG